MEQSGAWICGESVEGDIEAELQGSAMERMVMGMVGVKVRRRRMRVGLEAGPPEGAGAEGEESGGDVERSDLSVASPASQGQRVLEHRSSLGGEGLLQSATS